jgi:hypothetical protein
VLNKKDRIKDNKNDTEIGNDPDLVNPVDLEIQKVNDEADPSTNL